VEKLQHTRVKYARLTSGAVPDIFFDARKKLRIPGRFSLSFSGCSSTFPTFLGEVNILCHTYQWPFFILFFL